MSFARMALFLGAPALASLGVFTTADSASEVLKCRQTINTMVLQFIDGEVVSEERFKGLDTKQVLSVQIACLHPIDSTVLPPGSNEPGIGSIVVWTTNGPVSQLQAITTQLRDAQQSHFQRTGTYATSLDALDLRDVPASVRISLDAGPTHWRASVSAARLVSPSCVVFDGELTPPLPGTKGVVRCDHIKATH